VSEFTAMNKIFEFTSIIFDMLDILKYK